MFVDNDIHENIIVFSVSTHVWKNKAYLPISPSLFYITRYVKAKPHMTLFWMARIRPETVEKLN